MQNLNKYSCFQMQKAQAFEAIWVYRRVEISTWIEISQLLFQIFLFLMKSF